MKNVLLLYVYVLRALCARRFAFCLLFSIAVTYGLVVSGMDYTYLEFVSGAGLWNWLLLADSLGFLMPFIIPVALYFLAKKMQNQALFIKAKATVFAVVIGFTVSMFLKAITGRQSPPHAHHNEPLVLFDNSHHFQFGFMREQIIGGWPSSHTTIAFALAMTLAALSSGNKKWNIVYFIVAFGVGIGVTFGFHWLSEFVAGAIIGSCIGKVTGEYFKKK